MGGKLIIPFVTANRGLEELKGPKTLLHPTPRGTEEEPGQRGECVPTWWRGTEGRAVAHSPVRNLRARLSSAFIHSAYAS